jgi:hypothetical protein
VRRKPVKAFPHHSGKDALFKKLMMNNTTMAATFDNVGMRRKGVVWFQIGL